MDIIVTERGTRQYVGRSMAIVSWNTAPWWSGGLYFLHFIFGASMEWTLVDCCFL